MSKIQVEQIADLEGHVVPSVLAHANGNAYVTAWLQEQVFVLARQNISVNGLDADEQGNYSQTQPLDEPILKIAEQTQRNYHDKLLAVSLLRKAYLERLDAFQADVINLPKVAIETFSTVWDHPSPAHEVVSVQDLADDYKNIAHELRCYGGVVQDLSVRLNRSEAVLNDLQV